MSGSTPGGGAEVQIRPLAAVDLPRLTVAAGAAIADMRERLGMPPLPPEPEPSPGRPSTGGAILRQLLDLDAGGAWAAFAGDDLVGAAVAARRERLWYLAHLSVTPGHQGRGVGRRLLERAMAYGAGARGMLVHSSSDPQAMRAYQRAGFALEPALQATGTVRRDRLPALADVAPGDDLDLVAAVDRAQRGAAHGPDVEVLLRSGGRILATDRGGRRGYALVQDGGPRIVAATDEATAAALLWGALAESDPAGTAVQVLRADQQWAIDVCVRAGLDLAPIGPLCRRGDTGPMAPYLPHTGLL